MPAIGNTGPEGTIFILFSEMGEGSLSYWSVSDFRKLKTGDIEPSI